MDSAKEEAEEKILQETIKSLNTNNINFEKTNDTRVCRYCDYKYLCDMY